MEEILKEQAGMTSVRGPEVGIEEFQSILTTYLFGTEVWLLIY